MEKPRAVESLDAITALTDCVVVARGDLGVEMPPEEVPLIQKRIVRAARDLGKPLTVATQMLESMITSPSPARAEASDVATAVFDGADAVMLPVRPAADLRSPRRLRAGAEGHRHTAEPHRRDPAPGRLALAQAGDLVRRARRPGVRGKKGRIETFCTAPPEGSVAACLDEMGPVSAKSYPGRAPVRPQPPPAGRARQEIDCGRSAKGYVFGAFCPPTGAAFMRLHPGRGTVHWVTFLDEVEGRLPHEAERLYPIAENLSTHRATDVLLFMLAHPRWGMVFQPKYAACSNFIEPWWEVLRSFALAGRRFETWDEVAEAIAQATENWNAHRHPFLWGQRRRHRPRRQPGIALLPRAA